jgi:hypothetical protein
MEFLVCVVSGSRWRLQDLAGVDPAQGRVLDCTARHSNFVALQGDDINRQSLNWFETLWIFVIVLIVVLAVMERWSALVGLLLGSMLGMIAMVDGCMRWGWRWWRKP